MMAPQARPSLRLKPSFPEGVMPTGRRLAMTLYGEPAEPLGDCVGRCEGAKVRFSCTTCGSGHDIDAAPVVWLLKARALGDEQTSVADCARLDDHACVRGGGTRWEAWPCSDEKAR